MNFDIKESKVIFKGKVFDLQVDIIEYNDTGNKAIREVAIHPGGAVVLPILDNGKIIVVKQYRYPFDRFLFELPAGKLEKDEDPAYCAKRELTEETGYSASEIIKMGSIFTTPGFCTEELHLYAAKGLTKGDHNREEGEQGMEVYEYTLDEIIEMIKNGEIVDSKTICSIFHYQLTSF
ncbi:MAG: NUDIX hydrolase [Ignavibacteriae bacterium]|nr:NUDIX hydrolase [Ignavibacteriota bacterium]NOG98162.1 NUDIX hydrolase [Ignavibacteriota bacterium]